MDQPASLPAIRIALHFPMRPGSPAVDDWKGTQASLLGTAVPLTSPGAPPRQLADGVAFKA